MEQIAVAVIGGLALVLVAVLGLFGARRLDQIHGLVNSSHEDALEEIRQLRRVISSAAGAVLVFLVTMLLWVARRRRP